MSKSNDYENDLLLLAFNNVNAANIGDATGVRGSTAAGALYVALHTADPGEGGKQNTNEATYTGYARQSLNRDGSTFLVSGNTVTLAADKLFPVATAGSETLTYWSIGVAVSGATKILYSGALSPSIAVVTGVQPVLLAATNITED